MKASRSLISSMFARLLMLVVSLSVVVPVNAARSYKPAPPEVQATVDAVWNALTADERAKGTQAVTTDEVAERENIAVAAMRGMPETSVTQQANGSIDVTSAGANLAVPASNADEIAFTLDLPAAADEAAAAAKDAPRKRVPIVGVKVAGATPARAVIAASGGLVIYPNTARQADTVVQPTLYGGARLMTVIQGSKAPTSFRFIMSLPPKAQIVAEGDGFVVRDAADLALIHISKPWAYDAKGSPVPVRYKLQGVTLVMEVQHQGAAYPVVADPYYNFGMNAAEWNYCQWPWNYGNCVNAKFLADRALSSAQSRFPSNTLHNGTGDAYRHCFWNGLMTFSMGAGTAQGFGDRHEDYPGNPENEKRMDLHNNWWGRNYGNEYYWQWSRDSKLSNRCADNTRSGGALMVLWR